MEQPAPPQGTPPELCPGGLFEEGICLPSPPVFGQWTCPEGWLKTDVLTEEEAQPLIDQGTTPPTHCLPPELPAQCPPGTMPLVGQAECVRIGIECPPEGELWHDEETIRGLAPDYEEAIVYVLPQQDPPADEPDGTRARPFATLQAALDAAESGAILALGIGQYDEVLRPVQRTAIVGACVEQTAIIAPDTHEDEGTVRFLNRFGSLLSDVRVSGSRMGIEVGNVNNAIIQSVHVDAAMTSGIFALRSRSVVVTDVLVSDTRIRPSSRDFGRGLDVGRGTVMQAERVSFIRNHTTGVFASGEGTELRMSDVLVADTQPLPFNGGAGIGLGAIGGAMIQAERASILRNHESGVFALEEGTELSFVDALIADTLPRQSDDRGGMGLVGQEGTVVRLERTSIIRNHTIGILANSGNLALMMSDVLVADTQPQPSDGDRGFGLNLGQGAVIQADRVAFVRNHSAGISSDYEGTELRMSDVLIADTQPKQSDGSRGIGLEVQFGTITEVERATFLRNHTSSILAIGVGAETDLKMSDIFVADTQPRWSDGQLGVGLNVQSGAKVEVERAAFLRNHTLGAIAHNENTELKMSDVFIADTQPQLSNLGFGEGLGAQTGALMEVTRALLVRNHSANIAANGEGAELRLTDIRSEQARSVTLPTTMRQLGGLGLVVVNGAHATISRFEISQSDLVGIVLSRGGTLQATDGVVSDNFIGLNLRESDTDLSEALLRVDIRDNCCGDCDLQVCNVESQDIPIPDASQTIAEIAPP